MITQFLTQHAFEWFIVFIRISAAFWMVPGIGDAFISPRIRVLFAMIFSLILTLSAQLYLPPLPDSTLELSLLIISESVVGLYLGLVVRILTSAVETAGMIIAYQIGMANAAVFDPSVELQSSISGVFLGMVALLLIFVTDLHQLFFYALQESYELFKPGEYFAFEDMYQGMLQIIASSFSIGVKMVTPFIIIGLLYFLALGLLSRLMPQLQVFFIITPVQILLGLVLMALCLRGMSVFWLEETGSLMGQYLK